MNAIQVSNVVHCLGLVFGLVVLPDSARPSVITSGNIDPAGIGGVLPTNIVTRQDPWNVSGNLAVGDTSFGPLNVTDAGVVNNTSASIGDGSGVMGLATINGANSQWNNSVNLTVGKLSVKERDHFRWMGNCICSKCAPSTSITGRSPSSNRRDPFVPTFYFRAIRSNTNYVMTL